MIRKINRIKAKNIKSGLFWCHYCDAQIVGEGEKCLNCKKLNGIRRFKKRDYFLFK